MPVSTQTLAPVTANTASQELSARGWQVWSADQDAIGRVLWLCPLADFANVEDRTPMESINGNIKIKGVDEIDLSCRFGCLAFGLRRLPPSAWETPPTKRWYKIGDYAEWTDQDQGLLCSLTEADATRLASEFNSTHRDPIIIQNKDDTMVGSITRLEARRDGLYAKIVWNSTTPKGSLKPVYVLTKYLRSDGPPIWVPVAINRVLVDKKRTKKPEPELVPVTVPDDEEI